MMAVLAEPFSEWKAAPLNVSFSSESRSYIVISCHSATVTCVTNTGGSCLSRTAVKPDSHLARIFFPKFGFLFPV